MTDKKIPYGYYNDCNKLKNILDEFQKKSMRRFNRIQNIDSLSSVLVGKELIDELKELCVYENMKFYFGKTLRDIKCVLKDKDDREHSIQIFYRGPKKLAVVNVDIPNASIEYKGYSSLNEIVNTYKQKLQQLENYFRELETIDKYCTVMEPANPSFKEDFRRILIDNRTWLHVEVTPEGLARNIHLLGSTDHWHDKLQSGLIRWDHDMDIVKNIMLIFELSEFPDLENRLSPDGSVEDNSMVATVCSICLCDQLPDSPGLPLPLCPNNSCGVYFHRSCLFQWLVACIGGRPPAFGVATGTCPTCLNPITCNEKDT